MNMRLRDKFRMFAGSLLLALVAVFALSTSGMPLSGAAAVTHASFGSDLGEARQPHGAVPAAPEHASACFEPPHDPCGPGGVAPAPAASAALDAMPNAGLVKAPALLPAPMPDVAPHAAASLSILFRNFRE
ncbi:MAG: hypothetical protein A3G81_34490 [Betaproteobacteria bacterium RIFCSPLOWO2_12_FULL_65_14]|nr:MAG: hypothetical protein A3G81_34490 [Betaproteobacteria bacterium RIFCSPLOWO2_12_FULL_65_14]